MCPLGLQWCMLGFADRQCCCVRHSPPPLQVLEYEWWHHFQKRRSPPCRPSVPPAHVQLSMQQQLFAAFGVAVVVVCGEDGATDRCHSPNPKHLLCMGWRNFRTGVSCFSKTLFYFSLLALTYGRVTCRWHPKEFGSPVSVGGLSNFGAIVHTPCSLELCSPPTNKFQSGFTATNAAPIKKLIFVVLHRQTNRLGCCRSPWLFSLATALLPLLFFIVHVQI